MNKNEKQAFVNTICIENYREAMLEMNEKCPKKKLRTCKAYVIETANYFVLVSYSTVVAIIDKLSDTLYDVLRWTFGFTRTSSQHISKFEKDYCKGKWSCEIRLTYRS